MSQLYKNYTSCCRGNHRTTKINPNSTDDEIRKYMLGEHNQNSTQEIHKAVAYHITDPKISRAISPSFLEILKQKGIHLPIQLEEYVILHAGLPVDTMTKQELSKYIHQHENSRLRQPAA
ncbi:MAG: hypothetical protein V1889_03135 [archaeon]